MTHDLSTIAGVQAALDELPQLMAAKGLVRPEATFGTKSGGRKHICIRADNKNNGLGVYGSKYFHFDDDIADAVENAKKAIAAFPDPQTAALHSYMKKAAELVDQGRADNIPDEYVDPVRITVKAMTDNLLAPPTE